VNSGFALDVLRQLEQSSYLERVLLPMPTLNHQAAMSMVALLNIKHLE
jgi:hypothetical protein